jgi:hypothetical protein
MRKQVVSLWVVLLIGTLVSSVLGAGPAGAATARSTAPLKLTTSPLPVVLDAKPGQTVSTNIKMKQSGGDTEQLKVSLMKFSSSGDTGKPSLSERGPGDDYFDWVKFDKPTFTAQSDVWQTIKMTVNVPKSAAFSYYYAVVFSRVGDEQSPGGGKAGIAGGTAVLVMMDVNAPGATSILQLQSFGVTHRVMEFLPTEFTVKLANVGNTFVRPGGTIFINQGGKQVGLVDFNDGLGTVLDNSKRLFTENWSYGWPYYAVKKDNGRSKQDANGNPQMALNWALPAPKPREQGGTAEDDFIASKSQNPLANIRFGEYTAHLLVVYTDGHGHDVPLESTVSFWVIPWRALLILLAVLLVVGFGFYSSFRRAAGWARVKRRFSRRR